MRERENFSKVERKKKSNELSVQARERESPLA